MGTFVPGWYTRRRPIENFACPLATHNEPPPREEATGFIRQPTAKRALRKEAKSKTQR